MLAASVAAAVLGGACTSGLGLAGTADAPAPTGPADAAPGGGPAATSAPVPGAADVPAPAPDPASVPGAERFGVAATDGFCDAAPKVASAFVGLFSSVYAGQGPALQAQVESAVVAIDVLRSVAPEATRSELDASRAFLSRLHDVLADSGWSLEAAAQANRDFFGGPEPDAGFAAMTSVMQAISATCGFTP